MSQRLKEEGMQLQAAKSKEPTPIAPRPLEPFCLVAIGDFAPRPNASPIRLQSYREAGLRGCKRDAAPLVRKGPCGNAAHIKLSHWLTATVSIRQKKVPRWSRHQWLTPENVR
jgi:hypothetical protein